MNIWMSWQELNSVVASKKDIYLYGRSVDWVHKCLNNLRVNPKCIIDREKTYHGKKYFDLEVYPIEKIKIHDEIFIIITAGDYEGIVDLLESRGLKPGYNFVCSPDFQDYKKLLSFHSKNFNILISCSDYNDQTRARASREGGGLYELNTKTFQLKKKLSGSFRQFDNYNSNLLAVDYVSRELLFINKDYKIEKKIQLNKPNYCGLAIDNQNHRAYIANAGDDTVLLISELDKKKPKLSEIQFIKKPKGKNREAHVNDLYFFDDKIFFSYFSRSGNYKLGVFDGGVSHYDQNDGNISTEMISKLWKPHSPKIFNGKLWVLDSMRGKLISGFGSEYYNIGGFVRGLDFYNDTIVIGQSQDMYLSDRVAQGDSVSIDSGVHLFDTDSKALRFVPINKIMNIHDLKVLNIV
tara:strand:- start:628 stop:1851 length:1224 start_codon:yes stop_codon:yes gene_type:complete